MSIVQKEIFFYENKEPNVFTRKIRFINDGFQLYEANNLSETISEIQFAQLYSDGKLRVTLNNGKILFRDGVEIDDQFPIKEGKRLRYIEFKECIMIIDSSQLNNIYAVCYEKERGYVGVPPWLFSMNAEQLKQVEKSFEKKQDFLLFRVAESLIYLDGDNASEIAQALQEFVKQNTKINELIANGNNVTLDDVPAPKFVTTDSYNNRKNDLKKFEIK